MQNTPIRLQGLPQFLRHAIQLLPMLLQIVVEAAYFLISLCNAIGESDVSESLSKGLPNYFQLDFRSKESQVERVFAGKGLYEQPTYRSFGVRKGSTADHKIYNWITGC